MDLDATTAFNAANVALIQAQVDTASLLAFFVGIFSFGSTHQRAPAARLPCG
jgi:hypothetical protein